jgi:hypothetical protein
VIKGMLWYVRQFSFKPFAVYRVLLGIVVFAIMPPNLAKEKGSATDHGVLRQPHVEAAAFARGER